MQSSSEKKKCEGCGGLGQSGSFQGVSRFFITWEECPECCGLGFILDEDESDKLDGSSAVGKDEVKKEAG